jgi:hypothetical protein
LFRPVDELGGHPPPNELAQQCFTVPALASQGCGMRHANVTMRGSSRGTRNSSAAAMLSRDQLRVDAFRQTES